MMPGESRAMTAGCFVGSSAFAQRRRDVGRGFAEHVLDDRAFRREQLGREHGETGSG